MPGQPYRFLDDYRYTKDDIEIFHGRKRETAILVSELTTRRLVVLFAPTGTGKSSLINAGVRPQLEGSGYKTLLIRVEKDPNRSLRAVLVAEKLLPQDPQPPSLGQCIRNAIQTAGRPLVIFLDQFEEFFLYQQRENPDLAQQFVRDIAELYRDRDAGAHFAFSLREDFFVEMDVFRDEIPTIFNQNSAIRLRALRRDQARDAICKPAEHFGVSFDKGLVSELLKGAGQPNVPAQADEERQPEVLLDDLVKVGDKGLISPAHLQIVCDTLWKERQGASQITVELYKQIGPVERILDQRFRDDIAGTLSDQELILFAKLLPFLRSDEGRGTKSVLSLKFLPAQLKTDLNSVNELVKKLTDLRLMRSGSGDTVNWASDYLSGRLEHFLWAARSTYLRRLIHRSMKAAAEAKASPASTGGSPMPPTLEEVEARFMKRRDFEEITTDWKYLLCSPGRVDGESTSGRLELTSEEIRFLFEASLEHGLQASLWFERASDCGVDVMGILRNRIIDPNARTEQAENAIRILVRSGTSESFVLLREAVAQPIFSSFVILELGTGASPGALQILDEWLVAHPQSRDSAALLSHNWCSKARDLLKHHLGDQSVTAETHSLQRVTAGFAPAIEAESSLRSEDWQLLLRRMRDGKVVPVIGMGTLARKVAADLAARFSYPFASQELPAIGEFVPRPELVLALREQAAGEEGTEDRRLAAALAALPMPCYLTTRYDDVLTEALNSAGRQPIVQLPAWRGGNRGEARGPDPTVRNPLVYHLHGHFSQPESIILTLQDVLTFIRADAKDNRLVSLRVLAGLVRSDLLLLDYDPGGLEFHSVLQFLARIDPAHRRSEIIVPTSPAGMGSDQGIAAQKFYWDFLQHLGMRPHIDSYASFALELKSRWEALSDGSSSR
jgi:hypothetical protein